MVTKYTKQQLDKEAKEVVKLQYPKHRISTMSWQVAIGEHVSLHVYFSVFDRKSGEYINSFTSIGL